MEASLPKKLSRSEWTAIDRNIRRLRDYLAFAESEDQTFDSLSVDQLAELNAWRSWYRDFKSKMVMFERGRRWSPAIPRSFYKYPPGSWPTRPRPKIFSGLTATVFIDDKHYYVSYECTVGELEHLAENRLCSPWTWCEIDWADITRVRIMSVVPWCFPAELTETEPLCIKETLKQEYFLFERGHKTDALSLLKLGELIAFGAVDEKTLVKGRWERKCTVGELQRLHFVKPKFRKLNPEARQFDRYG